jgi:dipeptidyl aminopeptidase/acylaminoacyl peptidase
LLLGVVATAGQAPMQRAFFSLQDRGSLVRLSKPALSPDGKQAALVVSRPDPVQNEVVFTLELIDTRTGAARIIATGKAGDLTWSPSGRSLAWLAPDADKTGQIMTISFARAEGAPSQLTHTAKGAGVRAFAWSPDEKSFAYLAGESPVPLVGDARFDRTFEVSDSDYLGTTYLARSRGESPARLWLIDAQGGEARRLSPTEGYLRDLAWAADGEAVVFNSNPGTSDVSARFGSVRSVDIAGGQETSIVPKDAHVSSESRIRLSPQGVLAYQHYRGQDPWLYGNTVAVVIDGQVRDLTTGLDRDVGGFEWLPRGDGVLVSARDHVRTGLWTVSLTGAVRRLDLGEVNLDSGASSSSVGSVAFIGSEAQLPPELYVMTSRSAKPVRLTHFNESLLLRRYGRVKTVVWKSGGFDHDGLLVYPPDFRADQRYPLLVNIHGGPHYSSQLSFDDDGQYYAANGWLVFQPNYRGSDGQGDRYQTAVIGDATEGPGHDIVAGIAAIKAEGNVVGNRIALTGWSYGGVMTSWLIGHHHDWCAAVPGALVVDFAGYYDQSDTGIWIDSLLGSPHLPQNARKYLEQSPATYLDQATTPTLIMQNVGDNNAPVAQAYGLYHALRDRGIKTKFVIFGIDGHGPGDPYHERQAVVRTLAWINENCGPGNT